MDLTPIPGSRIVEVARLAFATPDVLFLCFGESDQPSPAAARQAAIAAIEDGDTRYPDVRGQPPLRDALAAYLTGLYRQPVTEDRIQVTASGMAAISIALAGVVRAGHRVLIHSPIWPNIGNAALLRGASVETIDLDPLPEGGFRLDLDRLDRAMAGVRAFVVNSPNNPTGWTATEAELRAIRDIAARHGAWIISDEVYARLIYDDRPAAPSMLDVAEPDDRVIVCNSFSKTWVMTGWRLGWLVVPAGTGAAFADITEAVHSGVAPFVQRAGIAAVADTDAVSQFRAHCAAGRALVGEALGGLNGVRYRTPDGAFYAFLGVDGMHDSLDFAKRLVTRHGIALAPGVAFGDAGEGSLRVCFAQSPELMQNAMQRLRDGLRAELGA
ncbi:MAG TPA: pyridoxal phosphate-dependent aminotransferase [Rhodopila sp.]|uniref:pyridoxal phosphate-dependent aminotransferase n=1 Tax=Rhodopila sp. TaxID=2480087 RepID=UPI002C159433|nr:pyridoxal phosphate-dependent aminotransferase [Rhodopila sp.]HVY18346.1 pyridoxal phosphate-dependent aminotransferase [Rhodopila sp.]